jgi:hypothetical protein
MSIPIAFRKLLMAAKDYTDSPRLFQTLCTPDAQAGARFTSPIPESRDLTPLWRKPALGSPAHFLKVALGPVIGLLSRQLIAIEFQVPSQDRW